MSKNKETKSYSVEFKTDPMFITQFALNYNLDPEKDFELIKEIHSITTVRHVYDAKCDTTESVVEYFDKIKDFVTSERYRNMSETGKHCFERRVFEVLKGITIKGIGTEYFITGTMHYLSKPNVNEPLD